MIAISSIFPLTIFSFTDDATYANNRSVSLARNPIKAGPPPLYEIGSKFIYFLANIAARFVVVPTPPSAIDKINFGFGKIEFGCLNKPK